jgi:hypothetical protein
MLITLLASGGDGASGGVPKASLESMAFFPVARPNEKMAYISS